MMLRLTPVILTEIQVRNIWNNILAAEAISMDESHEMCEAVSKIQFNRLTLVREAFVEQQLRPTSQSQPPLSFNFENEYRR